MTQFKLDCIPADCLDLDNYVYRWVDDRPGRLHMATRADDYDFVTTDELHGGWMPYDSGAESDDRVRMPADVAASGAPIYSYLCKKRRDFWEADQEEIVRKREDMMAGRVYRGEATESGKDLSESISYVPSGVQMGGAAERRRGPIPKSFK